MTTPLFIIKDYEYNRQQVIKAINYWTLKGNRDMLQKYIDFIDSPDGCRISRRSRLWFLGSSIKAR